MTDGSSHVIEGLKISIIYLTNNSLRFKIVDRAKWTLFGTCLSEESLAGCFDQKTNCFNLILTLNAYLLVLGIFS